MESNPFHAKKTRDLIRRSSWIELERVTLHGAILVGEFPTFGHRSVLELQLPEISASTSVAEGFWELQSENTWVTQGEGP